MKSLLILPALMLGCQPQTTPVVPKTPPEAKAAAKPVELGTNVFLEVLPSGQRRVLITAEIVFREGLLELFLCRKFTKEHESVVAAEVDARDIHKALLAAGAQSGHPVKFEPQYVPADGAVIKVFIRYSKDGKEVTIRAQEWVRDVRTKSAIKADWVFGGSFFYPDPEDDALAPKKPKLYAANSGDVICVSNFGTAMLDLAIKSSDANADLQFEANTDKIPPLGTKVTVILEPVVEKQVQISEGKK